MSNYDQFLLDNIQNSLYPYQIDKINRQIKDFLLLNKDASHYHFDVCPKCGAIHPSLGGGGYTKAGKPMLKCKECGKRFVYDHGQLTFYSHQTPDKWDDLIIKTHEGDSLKKIAVSLDVNESTVFRMRHKYLHSLEEMESPICASR